jgi:DNA (cytosine-5)-methyltransferase 1
MRYGSVCSGIEAATVAWDSLGWTPQWFSEIEPFPSAVLAHHYPNVPNFGDMTKFKEWKLDDSTAIDVLVGGTPCQSFSVAGLRKGLEDPRGNLMLTYLAIANKYRPKWLVWENVPGVLSSNGGNDFASFLRGLGELGYGFAYRVLDAQYFGVAQRRRRVFVVGCFGDWRSAAAVLFERESLSRNPAPSREKGQEVAGTIAARFGISRNNHEECVAATIQARMGKGGADADTETLISQSWPADVASTLNASFGSKLGLENQHINSGAPLFVPCIALAENTIGRQPQNGGNGDGFTVGGPMYTLNATGVHGVAQPIAYNFAPGKGDLKDDIHITIANVSKTLDASGSNPAMHQGGTGVAQPIPLDLRNAGRDPEKHDAVNRQGVGVGEAGDPAHIVTSAFVHRVAQPVYELHGQDSRVKELKDVCGTVSATYGMGGGNVPVTIQPMVLMDQGGSVMNVMEDGTVGTLRRETHGHEPAVMHSPSMAVRRLTPVECERLQGFPDNYTNIPWRKQPESPDGPRYKALGNSMAVPVMHWIGKRIADAS